MVLIEYSNHRPGMQGKCEKCEIPKTTGAGLKMSFIENPWKNEQTKRFTKKWLETKISNLYFGHFVFSWAGFEKTCLLQRNSWVAKHNIYTIKYEIWNCKFSVSSFTPVVRNVFRRVLLTSIERTDWLKSQHSWFPILHTYLFDRASVSNSLCFLLRDSGNRGPSK